MGPQGGQRVPGKGLHLAVGMGTCHSGCRDGDKNGEDDTDGKVDGDAVTLTDDGKPDRVVALGSLRWETQVSAGFILPPSSSFTRTVSEIQTAMSSQAHRPGVSICLHIYTCMTLVSMRALHTLYSSGVRGCK